MSWRPARRDELGLLWPAVRSAHIATSLSGLEAIQREASWSIRISEAGDAMVLRPWREHLKALSIRAAWAPARRIGWLVEEARSVAAERGFELLLSPLLAESAFGPYAAAGMTVEQRLVALQGIAAGIPLSDLEGVAGARLRRATPEDLPRLLRLDAECFDDFWRYGDEELNSVLAAERVAVCERGDAILGYSSCSVTGTTMTLGRLAVSSGHRRQGLGASLVGEAVAWGLRHGALGVSLCTQEENEASQSLYRGLGFAAVGERYVIGSCPAGAQRAG